MKLDVGKATKTGRFFIRSEKASWVNFYELSSLPTRLSLPQIVAGQNFSSPFETDNFSDVVHSINFDGVFIE